jgi:hypothetical protein
MVRAFSGGPLTLRRIAPDLESYATLSEHSELGKIDDGRIAMRIGNRRRKRSAKIDSEPGGFEPPTRSLLEGCIMSHRGHSRGAW